jgi:transposase
MALRLRAVGREEEVAIKRLAASRTEPARLVERARILQRALAGERVPAIAAAMGIDQQTARTWIKRFNAGGLDGLADAARPGRPVIYPAEQVGEMVAASLTKPAELGLPFACWTLDRLVAYLAEAKGIGIRRSRLEEILIAAGLRWRTQETWFGARVDPDFAQQRVHIRGQVGCRGTPLDQVA